MKTVIEIFRLPNGSPLPQFYCVEEDGTVIRHVTNTLLDLASELTAPEAQELCELLTAVESARYSPDNPSLPDWGTNDKNIWMLPPKARMGFVIISNENIDEYSQEYGEPQEFSIKQLKDAVRIWQDFIISLQELTKENMIGKRFEITI